MRWLASVHTPILLCGSYEECVLGNSTTPYQTSVRATNNEGGSRLIG